jgi:cholest-4-en-3-one 26-monooxygenase
MKTAAKIDVFDPDQYVPGVPHHMFDRLRAEAPVYFHPEPGGPGFWCLTRYDDVVDATRAWRVHSSARGSNIPDFADVEPGVLNMMINTDPPYHTKLRNLVRKGFTPRMVDTLEAHTRELCGRILDRIAPTGSCDFVTEVAAELPLEVICELLGVRQDDRHLIFKWSNDMMGMDDPEYGNSLQGAQAAAFQMFDYMGTLAAERRLEPKEDLVSVLVEAEMDGERLTEMEYRMFVVLLSVAGNETTRNAISGGLLALIEHPEQRERLIRDPSLIPCAVEEILRWVTPVMHFRRTATEDVELHGKQIRAGDKVVLWYISANRDEDAFPDAHRFDVARAPNEHVTFGGGGPHFCLGFAVARMEIRVMFEELLKRLPDVEPAGPVARLRSNWINGIKHLPIRYPPDGT